MIICFGFCFVFLFVLFTQLSVCIYFILSSVQLGRLLNHKLTRMHEPRNNICKLTKWIEILHNITLSWICWAQYKFPHWNFMLCQCDHCICHWDNKLNMATLLLLYSKNTYFECFSSWSSKFFFSLITWLYAQAHYGCEFSGLRDREMTLPSR